MQEALETRNTTKNPLIQSAVRVQVQAMKSMRKGGKKIGPRGGKVSEPAPRGKPPHVQTGALRANIRWALTIIARKVTAIVGPTRIAWYGRRMEDPNDLNRRFMRPALLQVRRKFAPLFANMKLASTAAGRRLNGMGKR